MNSWLLRMMENIGRQGYRIGILRRRFIAAFATINPLSG